MLHFKCGIFYNSNFTKMKNRLVFILKYWLSWILFFVIGRLIFTVFFVEEVKAAGFQNYLSALWQGLRLDASMAAYFTVPVSIFTVLSVYSQFFRKYFIYFIYSFILSIIAVLITMIDVGSFQAWGIKVEPSFLSYLKTPKEAFASIKNFPLIPVLIGFIALCTFIFIYLKRYLIRATSKRLLPVLKKWQTLIMMLVITVAFVIPMRGGLQGLPINQSSVYFSKNNFSNISAINANFSFFFNLIQGAGKTENPFVVMDTVMAKQIVSSYFKRDADSNRSSISSAVKIDSNTNVILVIWESFTQKATLATASGVEVTPKFNVLKKEGVYFSNIYATGDRTDKGIAGILSGYPAQPTTSILKTPTKSASLPMLSNVFKKNGYSSHFYYGGKGDFANMNAYLSNGNFDELYTFDDLKIDSEPGNWGYHDGAVGKKLIEGFSKMKTPFFLTWLTLTSHQPYKTPVPTAIVGEDEQSLFFNSLHYTDEVLSQFVQECKKQDWWGNTLLVVVADHGHRIPATGSKFDDFRIPLLFLGGAVRSPGLVEDAIGSQIDLATTLVQGISHSDSLFEFGNSLFDNSRKPTAYFSFMNGFGFLTPNQKFIYDNVGKQIIGQSDILDTAIIKAGKAFQQYFFQDYLDR